MRDTSEARAAMLRGETREASRILGEARREMDIEAADVARRMGLTVYDLAKIERGEGDNGFDEAFAHLRAIHDAAEHKFGAAVVPWWFRALRALAWLLIALSVGAVLVISRGGS